MMQVVEKSDSMMRVRLNMQQQSTFFEGHFPEASILPGVTQLHWVILLAKQHWPAYSAFVAASRIKFQKPIQPADVIDVEIQHRGDGVFHYHYACGEQMMSSGVFTLSANLTISKQNR